MTEKQSIILTDEMRAAERTIRTDRRPIFITGKAGTGKTTFLKYLSLNMGGRVVITAPTGVAAINAGGTTLHSLFRIPFGVLSPSNHTGIHRVGPAGEAVIKNIDILIIDEISMVRPDILDFVDWRLRTERQCTEPFGGVQLIMFGDLFQLPPVAKAEEMKVLKNFYEGEYFFYSQALCAAGMNIIELSQVFRQSDDAFVNILNRIRDYSATEEDMLDLYTLRDVDASQNFDDKTIHICTHKQTVQKINDEKLGTPTFTWLAEYEGDFRASDSPCEEKLLLKVGARVMTITNNHQQNYVNGSLGEIKAIKGTLTEPKIEVMLDNGNLITVTPNTWEAHDYKVGDDGAIEKTVKGKCKQFPLVLAWAITIHKSQGLTFDNVALHINRAFCPGQVYVALSRCRTLDGITTDVFVKPRHIIPDMRLVAFERAYKQNGNFWNNSTLRNMIKIANRL